jgi:hypothetical protein
MTAHPVLHILHDVGAAAWFGGSLMGATGLNGAAAQLSDPRERARASTAGWSRWAPVNGAAVVAHTVGAAGLLRTELPRVKHQQGVGRSSAIKTAITAAGLGVSAWSAVLNRKMAAAGPVPVQGSTEASAATPPDVAKTLKQLKLVQWLNPLLAGGIVVVTSWQEEQMRTSQVVPGLVQGLTGRLPKGAPAAAALGLGVLALKRRSKRRSSVDAYPQPVVRHPQVPADGVSASTTTLGSTAGAGSVTPMPPVTSESGVYPKG